MDTSGQVVTTIEAKSQGMKTVARQRWSIAEKRRMVEETLVEGASVARIARSHDVNANQLFGWRRLYLSGRLGEQKSTIKLLPVQVRENGAPAGINFRGQRSGSIERARATAVPGTIHVDVRQAQVRIEGSADLELVRILLECLGR